ncbi:MAG: peptidyl-prolyl cis-trans isomerase [Clostridiales bacterium]|nr:peptidyl-prolyl cis-trans isomerase [Clostridiales bacterium]
MNKSKKTLKGPKKTNKKQFTIHPAIWIAVGAVLGLSLIIGILIDQFYNRPLLTIDEKKYYLDDLTYHFYGSESAYNYIDQIYGGSYWDMPYDDTSNITVREYAKLEVINSVIYSEILYNEAVANGYTLTEEEIDEINQQIDTTLEGLTDKVINKNGFTREYLEEVFTKNMLGARYKQDIIDTLDIDDEEIRAGINYDDYRQYDIEYLYISKNVANDEDDAQDSSSKKNKLALDRITNIREKALVTEDWSTLLPEDEKDLIYRESNFIPSDNYFSEDLKSTLLSMENGDITDVVEEDDGYYVFRMVNNNSSETYEKTVEDAIKEKEEEAFSKEYNESILPNHTFELNNRAIRNLRMGRITLVD